MALKRSAPQRDLFGGPRAPARDVTSITIPMVEVGAGTDRAWHLKPAGAPSSKAAFAPRSAVSRGSGHQQQFFTMPRWIAAERGWLP